jgi:predicted GIY-YIG superfamily endonuclease
MSWFTYILCCDQKTYYVGITQDLSQRLHSHRERQNIGTKEFSDIQLVYSEIHSTRKGAEAREKQLKKWSYAKKKALVEGDIAKLIRLSRNREVVDGRQG